MNNIIPHTDFLWSLKLLELNNMQLFAIIQTLLIMRACNAYRHFFLGIHEISGHCAFSVKIIHNRRAIK